MIQGKLKWFDPKKGYGFITPDDDSKDVFFNLPNIYQMGELSDWPYLCEEQQVDYLSC